VHSVTDTLLVNQSINYTRVDEVWIRLSVYEIIEMLTEGRE